MEFGPVPVTDARGAILAHSAEVDGENFAKGRILSADDCARLRAAGHETITVARLGPDDLGEAEAAVRLAQALVPDPAAAGLELTEPVNGRVNLRATGPGVLVINSGRLVAANAVDPAITVATLPPLARVATGQIVATVKIITYGVAEALVAHAARHGEGALRRQEVRLKDASLVLTQTPGMKPGLLAKGRAAVAARLAALGIALDEVSTVAHETEAVAEALRLTKGGLVLILTAAATSDPADVAPAAVRAAGGKIDRFGIPADPGNLLFLGALGARPVIGLPGCARSVALNGADWVLDRVACGIPILPADFAALGLGGLLKETPARGQRRDAAQA